MNYGEILFKLRENKNINQTELANILNIDHSQYSHYEVEDRIIPIKHLNTLANYFNVSIDYLFCFTKVCRYKNSKKEINLTKQKENLKILRKSMNLTQQDLANLLGTDNSTISKYEQAKQIIPTMYLYAISKKYNVSADYLLGKIDEPKHLNSTKK